LRAFSLVLNLLPIFPRSLLNLFLPPQVRCR